MTARSLRVIHHEDTSAVISEHADGSLTAEHVERPISVPGGRGGIGRRTRLKIWRTSVRGGSNPPACTCSERPAGVAELAYAPGLGPGGATLRESSSLSISTPRFSAFSTYKHGPVAQLEERLSEKQEAAGSNPAWATPSERGGIGIRAWLRAMWAHARGGSSPSARTARPCSSIGRAPVF